jgi:hypothetical protein
LHYCDATPARRIAPPWDVLRVCKSQLSCRSPSFSKLTFRFRRNLSAQQKVEAVALARNLLEASAGASTKASFADIAEFAEEVGILLPLSTAARILPQLNKLDTLALSRCVRNWAQHAASGLQPDDAVAFDSCFKKVQSLLRWIHFFLCNRSPLLNEYLGTVCSSSDASDRLL